MQLTCPQCQAPIPASDVNVASMAAKCAACDSVFSFADDVAAPSHKPVEPVQLPSRFTIDERGSELIITRRWFSSVIVFFIFFCLFWDGFLVVWYIIAFTGQSPLIMKIFPIGHLAVGVGLTWFTIAGVFNRTTIAVNYDRLSIRHRPIPWFGNREIPANHIEQLFVDTGFTQNNRQTYRVRARTNRSKTIKLIGGLKNREEALFIEQQVEKFLGIDDQRVAGEA